MKKLFQATAINPEKIIITCDGSELSVDYVLHGGIIAGLSGFSSRSESVVEISITDRLDAIIAGLKDRKGAGRPRPFATVFHDGSMFHTDEGTIHYSPLDPSRDLRAQIAPRTTEITTDQALTDEIIVNGEKYKKA